MNESSNRIPTPNPISSSVAGTIPLTHSTMTTGMVFMLVATATVAPVSPKLRVKAIMAPESIEYLASGKTIVVKTLNGLAPKVLAASSMSVPILSKAADMDLTIYG